MRSRPAADLWTGSGLGAAFFLAAVVLAAEGNDAALAATARLSFLLFWAAYAGSALTALAARCFSP